jgi:hypothetical protein
MYVLSKEARKHISTNKQISPFVFSFFFLFLTFLKKARKRKKTMMLSKQRKNKKKIPLVLCSPCPLGAGGAKHQSN